jgi:predicted transcriptional regulator of viral defense system
LLLNETKWWWMKLSEFLNNLIAKGYYSFTSAQVKEALGVSDIAARAALRRLKQKGALAQPVNGFYVIVPPEYRILGCRPAEHFITELMEYIRIPYYVGLLSAAQYHGAAHHRPQQFQIITNQKRRPITCGRVKIVFITKKDVAKIPTQKLNTSHGYIVVSTPEATAMDIVIYANRCGGLDNTFSVLTDLVDKIDTKKLLKLVSQSEEITWVQRLGYLLESINAKKISNELEKKIRNRNTHIRVLAPIKRNKISSNLFLSTPIKLAMKKSQKSNLKINKKWKLIINKKLEPDT